MADACVVVLVGLPGSGKTTLAKNLRKFYESGYSADTCSSVKHGPITDAVTESVNCGPITDADTNACASDVQGNKNAVANTSESMSSHQQRLKKFYDKYTVLHVSYDELMPNEKQLIGSAVEASEWKLYRQNIVAEVYNVIHKHLGRSNVWKEGISSVPADGLAPNGARPSAGTVLKDHFHCLLNQPGVNIGHGTLVVLIDDNMYYSSMRYEYFQMCRELEISFAQVYVKCSLQNALMQNQQRERSVKEEVIHDMVLKMEEPDLRQSWEKYSVIWQIGMDLQPITELLTESLANPVRDTITQAAVAREASRVICSQSQIHQVDRILRALVSESIKALKANGTNADVIKAKAKAANETRASVMQQVKDGSLMFPEDTDWAEAAQNQSSGVRQELSDIFLQRFNSADEP